MSKKIPMWKREQDEKKRKLEAKRIAVTAVRTQANNLLTIALRDKFYTNEERRELSNVVRSLDSVVGDFCNDRRR